MSRAAPAGDRLVVGTAVRRRGAGGRRQDDEEIIERVAALDIGKAELVCCVRVPGTRTGRGGGCRRCATYSTMTRSLLGMADRLRRAGGDPGGDGGHLRLLEAGRSTCWRRTGSRPGWSTPRTSSTCRAGPRPTSWTRCGCARSPSGRCSGPASCRRPQIRQLRDLTRYRVDLVAARTAEKQRVEKLLEDAQIKLSVVASDIFGVSGRDDDGRADRRGARPEGAGAAGPRPDARQDHRAGGGVHRPLHRPPRVPAGQDAGPRRRDQRRHRRRSTPGSRS